jgi:hypothetical protein
MARFTLTLTGRTPLVVHNSRLADPEDEIVRQIKEITSKRKKTDEDHRTVGRLEWYGGLYLGDDREPVLPTANVRRCLVEAAKTRKLGKQLGRAVSFVEFLTPIIYDGPKDIDKLYSRPEFRLRASVVNNGQSRIMRVRPKFPAWEITADLELLDDMLNPNDLKDIASLAGLIEGLGDNRVNGFGRFAAELRAA